MIDALAPTKPKSWWLRLWFHVWPENVDTYILLSVAVGCCVFSFVGKLPIEILIAIILAVLALFSVALIRDRSSRAALIKVIFDQYVRGETQTADEFFSSKTQEDEIFERSHVGINIMQETGSLLLERFQSQIIRILGAGGYIKIVVSSDCIQNTTYLAFRNENLNNAEAIQYRLRQFREQINYIKSKCRDTTHLQVRYTVYDPGYTAVMSDINDKVEKNGTASNAIIRIAGFRIPYGDKLDFPINSSRSPRVFSQFSNKIDQLFCSSSKIVLLSAESRVGKTKIIQELVNLSSRSSKLFYVLSEAQWEGDLRTGFQVVTSNNPAARSRFATLKPGSRLDPGDVSKYEVDIAIWDRVATEINDANAARKVIIIDEIGEMQLMSVEFRRSIENIMADNDSVVIATTGNRYDVDPLIGYLKNHERSSVLSLSTSNEQSVLARLRVELEGAIRLAEHGRAPK